MIKRTPAERNFTTLHNVAIGNEGLSWAAEGLLHYLLGRPDHWEVSVTQLAAAKTGRGTSRDAIYALLKELIAAGFIVRTKAKSGKTDYLVFDTPQKPSAKPNTENPDQGKPDKADPNPENPDQEKPDQALATQVNTDLEVNTEPKQDLAPSTDKSGSTPEAEPVIVFECLSGERHEVTAEQVEQWRPAYPAVAIEQELFKARAWIEANPTKRKTKRGMCKFLVGWLSRTQDRGGNNGMRPVSAPTASNDISWASDMMGGAQ